MSFVRVSETSEVLTGKMKVVKIDGKEILIANLDGDFYAMGNKCTHAGGDLSKGSLEDKIVACRKHGSRFDVTTGKVVSGPKVLFLHPKIKDEPSYQVRVEGKNILVKVE